MRRSLMAKTTLATCDFLWPNRLRELGLLLVAEGPRAATVHSWWPDESQN